MIYLSVRNQILQALRAELEGSDRVHAFWEQGSTAMGRADQFSDLDLQVLVEAGGTEEAQERIERALRSVGEIDLQFVVPQPSWHGHWQAFYRLAGVSPYLLVDIVVMEATSNNRFLEPEIHGTPSVIFDRAGVVTQAPTDAAEFAKRLTKRLDLLAVPAELFYLFVGKELRRGREVDALSFYQSAILPRLVEALRTRYCPWRYNFGLRYLQYDLPAPVYAQVRDLVYVAEPAELTEKTERAMAILREAVAALRAMDLVDHLERSR